MPHDQPANLVRAGPLGPSLIASITKMCLSDTVCWLTLAAAAASREYVRILNNVGAQAAVADLMQTILRSWYGAAVDQWHFSQL